MSERAARAILDYGWPGNIRELQNRIEAAIALTRFDRVTERELGLGTATPRSRAPEVASPDLSSWSTIELRHIAEVLERAGGNKAQAARLLGIDRKTLYRKLRRWEGMLPHVEPEAHASATSAR